MQLGGYSAKFRRFGALCTGFTRSCEGGVHIATAGRLHECDKASGSPDEDTIVWKPESLRILIGQKSPLESPGNLKNRLLGPKRLRTAESEFHKTVSSIEFRTLESTYTVFVTPPEYNHRANVLFERPISRTLEDLNPFEAPRGTGEPRLLRFFKNSEVRAIFETAAGPMFEGAHSVPLSERETRKIAPKGVSVLTKTRRNSFVTV